ncbi:MAG: glycoside hydrolase family 3 N-terminal domain-containing protein [Sodalis sp. (in: enterobacteria)]|uniref:glycoside hydrolase family 3 N-terminal domain-containing protein n=1 Tax=Sodalis sp. (in: enterobacteria) TaxID=1898979 RepID=UPI0039E67349
MLGCGKLRRWLPIALCAWPLAGCIQEQDGKEKTEKEIERRVNAMSLEEKIGQKLMLDFRYWDPPGRPQQDMIASDATVAQIIRNNHIGGVILFANNLKTPSQIEALTSWYAAMKTRGGLRLFIATDNEGGSIFRLPHGDYATFPGNMALAAAVEGGADPQLAVEQGRWMAQDMQSLHINTNFAPVVDVNTNPFNPVINVRSFSDDAPTVACLAEGITAGMHQQRLITVYKHFPGHGSTSTDSHTSLPRVDRLRKDAFAIDIAPYKHAIDNHIAPDMIMTAHIQYPALDNTQIYSRYGEKMTVPATMSHEIQTNILRKVLGYRGVTISDALNMGAIADHFTQAEAVERVFAARVDIALMPVSITSPSEADRLSVLIHHIISKVRAGEISEEDINASVKRILRLKHSHLWQDSRRSLSSLLINGRKIEKEIADRSITVVINRHATLPLKDKMQRYLILTPSDEQAKGTAVMTQEGYRNVVAKQTTKLTDLEIKLAIAQSDVLLLGTVSTHFKNPAMRGQPAISDQEGDNRDSDASTLSWFRYAGILGKKRIHLSLQAPYDIVSFADNVDAAVATYSYYGYDNGIWLGPSMISLAQILTGTRSPQGRLPVTLWHNYDVDSHAGTVAFPRGYGLSW